RGIEGASRRRHRQMGGGDRARRHPETVATRWSCIRPCKEQAGNRQGEPAIISHSRRWLFVLYEKIVVPADARQAGGEPGPITKDNGYGSPPRGPRDASVAGGPSRGRPESGSLGRFAKMHRACLLCPRPAEVGFIRLRPT